MFGKVRLLLKLIYFRWTRTTITPSEFGAEYDSVAETYHRWLERMGTFSESILPEDSELRSGMSLLDLACGTGSLSARILKKSDVPFTLHATDISQGMLQVYQEHIRDARVSVSQNDILTFLHEHPKQFDMIFCGWALAYVNHREFFQSAFDALKKGGSLRVIANGSDSSAIIEDALRDVLARDPAQFQKYASLTESLPRNSAQLKDWGEACGFSCIQSGEGRPQFVFDTPEAYLSWQEQTGAIAGVRRMFSDFSKIRNDLLCTLEKYQDAQGQYVSSHPYVFAVYRKDES